MSNSKRNAKSANRLFPSSKVYLTEELRETYFEELFDKNTTLTNRLKKVQKKKKSKWEQGLTSGKVTRTYEKEAWELYRLLFINTSNYETFEVQVTPEHPFYVVMPPGKDGKGQYIAVKNLEIGYRCVSVAGCQMQLLEKEYLKLDEPVKVYNLEVEGSHNYFVGSSEETSLLVHNKCGPQNDNNNSNEPSTELAGQIGTIYYAGCNVSCSLSSKSSQCSDHFGFSSLQ